MNKNLVFYIVGMNTTIIGLSMLIPAIWSVYYKSSDLLPILLSALITTTIGLLLYFFLKPKNTEIRYKEGFAIVTFTWVFAALFGTLPFLLSGTLTNFPDAFFESMSGFTTTGATILGDIEALAPGILFWRSLTHWLGGMGILVLFIAILSLAGGSGGLHVFKAESTGLQDGKLRPRLSESAKILWFTYIILTFFLVLLLLAGGMNFFDSLCHAFSTMATGGFSTKNASIGYYDSAYIQWVITLFMFLGGVNFALYYVFYRTKKISTFFKNEEFRLYSILTGTAVVLTTLLLYQYQVVSNFSEALLDGAFQVVSIITTTGFASVDYNTWPDTLRVLIFGLMFLGGCAGSTVGSIKIWRYLILFKQMSQEFKRVIHPRIITKTKVCDKVIDDRQIMNIMQFFFIFIFIFICSSIIISYDGMDFLTALSAAAAAITNVGPGLNAAGPIEHYGGFSHFNKIFMSLLMLIGRLELYTVLVLFNPAFWKK